MKTAVIIKGILLISLSFFLINNGNCQDFSAFKKSLVEYRIGNTNYYISLPSGYKIRESHENGFNTVYFFQPADSIKNPLLNGGIYIGDYPKVIPPTKDSCIVLRKDREILHRHVIWLTFKCDDLIIMQSVFSDSEKSELPKINPFATVKNNVDIEKIYYIFSTMRKKQATNTTSTKDATPKVTGIGGIFFYSDNLKETKEWYTKNLGIEINNWGSSGFESRNVDRPDVINSLQWKPFKKGDDYFSPSKKDFMIDYQVQNLEGLVAKLKGNGVTILDSIATYDFGKFVHIMDTEGNKIELWEPIEAGQNDGNKTK